MYFYWLIEECVVSRSVSVVNEAVLYVSDTFMLIALSHVHMLTQQVCNSGHVALSHVCCSHLQCIVPPFHQNSVPCGPTFLPYVYKNLTKGLFVLLKILYV